jgi:hypothetical protein
LRGQAFACPTLAPDNFRDIEDREQPRAIAICNPKVAGCGHAYEKSGLGASRGHLDPGDGGIFFFGRLTIAYD